MLVASKHAATDNAYVGADVAQVTPLVGGPVRAVLVEDTQQVRRGDVLVRLDDTDARIAVAQAEANLASAIRKVQGLHATDSGLGAQIAARRPTRPARRRRSRAPRPTSRRPVSTFSGARRWPYGRGVGRRADHGRNAYNNAAASLRAAQAAHAQAGRGPRCGGRRPQREPTR